MAQLILSKAIDCYISQSWHIVKYLRDLDSRVLFPNMINSKRLKIYIILLFKDADTRLRSRTDC